MVERDMRRQKGFSLVELAIVLVIIGFLTGTTLAAQSMIKTAKIEMAVKQISEFDNGISSFKTKYNCLPGESPSFPFLGHPTINITPNCNGQIRDRNNSDVEWYGEIANTWRQLSVDGFGSKQYGQHLYTGESWKDDIPEFALKKNLGVILVTSDNTSVGGGGGHAAPLVFTNNETVYFISDMGPPGNTISSVYNTNATISPVDMLALDTKMDDGLANSGRVRATNGWDVVGAAYNPSTTGGPCGCVSSTDLSQYYTSWDSGSWCQSVCSMAVQVDPSITN